jgi:hypothetical protein
MGRASEHSFSTLKMARWPVHAVVSLAYAFLPWHTGELGGTVAGRPRGTDARRGASLEGASGRAAMRTAAGDCLLLCGSTVIYSSDMSFLMMRMTSCHLKPHTMSAGGPAGRLCRKAAGALREGPLGARHGCH